MKPRYSHVGDHWRVFCAIALPEEVREHISQHQTRVREAVPSARISWTRKENLHLTLKFLATVPISRVENLSSATARATGDSRPFDIKLEGPGVFPSSGNPHVLWIGVKDESGSLALLNQRVQDECLKEGFAREERPFHPHLTLGRLRASKEGRAIARTHTRMVFEPAVVAVTELLIIRSELSSDGSKYTVISRHPLGGQLEPSVRV